MNTLKDNSKRARYAVILIWIVFFIHIIMLVSNLFEYFLLRDIFSAANPLSDEWMSKANANDIRQRIIGIIFIVVFIFSATTFIRWFIRWFRRAYFNLHKIVKRNTYSVGWATSGWFIPIGNLYIPYIIMKELFDKTKTFLSEHHDIPERIRGNVNFRILIGFWWGLWLLSGIVGYISLRLSLNADGIEKLLQSIIVNIISDIISFPSALLTFFVIRNYSEIEKDLYEKQNTIFPVKPESQTEIKY